MAIGAIQDCGGNCVNSNTSVTTASFTPATAPTQLFVTVAQVSGATVSNAPIVTNSGTALTWTKIADSGSASLGGGLYGRTTVWVADVATASSMTVTVNMNGASAGGGFEVCQLTGVDTDYANISPIAFNSNGDPAATLATAPAADSTVLVWTLMAGASAISAPSGYTALGSTRTGGAIRFAAFYDQASASQGATFSTTNTTAAAAMIELKAASTGTTGSGNIVLDALTMGAEGELSIEGSSSLTLGALTTTSAGVLSIEGQSSLTLDPLVLVSSSEAESTGAGNITLAPLTTTGTGVLSIEGSSSIVLGALTTTSAGLLSIVGAGNITFAPLTISAGAGGPVNTSLPVITGYPFQGRTLTVTPGTWTGSPTLTYQWRANGVDIAGETGTTFVPGSAQEAKTIDVVETGTTAGGATNATAVATYKIGPPLASGNTINAEGASVMSGSLASDNAHRWITIFTTALGLTLSMRAAGGRDLQPPPSGYSGSSNVRAVAVANETGANKKQKVILDNGGDALHFGAAGLTNFVAYAREVLNIWRLGGYAPADIILCGMYPISDAGLAGSSISRATYEAYDPLIEQVAIEYGCAYADMYALTALFNPATDVGFDNLHPNDSGHGKIGSWTLYSSISRLNLLPLLTGIGMTSPSGGQLAPVWDAASGATGYEFEWEIGGNYSFGNTTTVSGGGSTGTTIYGLAAGNYRGRVRATYASGDPGPWTFTSSTPVTVAAATAIANIVFAPLAPAATGILSIEGQSSVILEPLVTTSAGVLPIEGTAGIVFDPLTTSSTATLSIVAVGNIALDPLTTVSAAILTIEGSTSIVFAPLEFVSEGGGEFDTITGVTTFVFDPLTTQSSAVLSISGSSSFTLQPLITQAIGELPIVGITGVVFAPLVMVSAGLLPSEGIGIVVFQPLTMASEAVASILAVTTFSFNPLVIAIVAGYPQIKTPLRRQVTFIVPTTFIAIPSARRNVTIDIRNS